MGGQGVGHFVLTPSQVTDPWIPAAQLRSLELQLVALALLLQDTLVPPPQLAVAVHIAFNPIGRFAASTGAGTARLARNSWSAALRAGAGAAEAGAAVRVQAARIN